MNILKFTFSAILIGIVSESIAQTTKSEPIFGSVVERKVQKDSTKKKSSFNLLRPAFLRIGVMGGGLISFENSATEIGSTSGLRVEYGFSNHWSLVGEVLRNHFEGTTFPKGQASLGVNWMPFKSKRLQPYFGLGTGIGGHGFRGGREGRNGRGFYGYTDDDSYNSNVQGFIFTRTGLNYVMIRRIIATVETNYQLPFDNSSSKGGLSFRIGASYQFSKKIKK